MPKVDRKLIIFVEIILLVLICLVLLAHPIYSKLHVGGNLPDCPDHWLTCFTLEHQITRILGMNPGGLWDGGYFFPFNKVSMLLNEPSWGVSVAVLPFWLVLRDIFFINNFAGIPALILSWIAICYFARALGVSRIYAFFAAFTFCLSSVSLALILDVYFFWPFFLIPLLGCLSIKMLGSPKIIWGIVFGVIFGYLAWSAAQLVFMGGSFLAFFIIWRLWTKKELRKYLPRVYLAGIVAILISALPYISMYLVHRELKGDSSVAEQVTYATNFANLLYTDMQWSRPLSIFNNLKLWENLPAYVKGETPIGVSVIILLFSILFFLYFLLRRYPLKKGVLKTSKILFYYSLPLLLAALNIFILKIFIRQTHFSGIDIAGTFFCYLIFGFLLVFLRNRIVSALGFMPFFFFLYSIFALSLAFGSYYILADGRAMPSPTILVTALLPGFSGIRASARWGLMFSFAISLGVFSSFAYLKKGIIRNLCALIIISVSFLDLFLGVPEGHLPKPQLHQWQPDRVDIFLKNTEGQGSVLELVSYPLFFRGEDLYSSLYHHRPIVTGVATVLPGLTASYLYNRDMELTAEMLSKLRRFGARFWVVHRNEAVNKEIFGYISRNKDFREIASFENGDILVYEDLNPNVAIEELASGVDKF